MFKHLLVPLDGSRLAEAALPVVVRLSTVLHASVTLIHVIERNAPHTIHGEHHLTNEDEACEYLGKTAERFFPPEARVECHVHREETRNVARSIVEHVSEFSPDLIVLTTHGEGGLRDLMTGSIAQQVIGRGKTPVLLIRPGEEAEAGIKFETLLVGMDGNPQHEQVLPVAADLAQVTGARLSLLTVVPTMETLSREGAATGRLLPGATAAMLEISVESAEQYLDGHVAALAGKGLRVNRLVRRGMAAQQIADAASQLDADLIVIGTHGKAGMGAFWAGSVAPRIPALTHIPLLLVPVH